MDRRRFLLTSLAGALAAPRAGETQQARKVSRVGFLSGGSAAAQKRVVEQFREGLRQLAYIEGQNIIIEHRWADGQLDRLPQLASDLARIGPDVIVAVASQAALAALLKEAFHNVAFFDGPFSTVKAAAQ
jgi:putative ABC transport system substrate-binding protein